MGQVCIFLGKKVDWDNYGTCPGVMDTCFTKWDPFRRQKKYIKSGHGMRPFTQVQVAHLICTESFTLMDDRTINPADISPGLVS